MYVFRRMPLSRALRWSSGRVVSTRFARKCSSCTRAYIRSSGVDDGEEICVRPARTRLRSVISDSDSWSAMSSVLGAPRGRGVRIGAPARMVPVWRRVVEELRQFFLCESIPDDRAGARVWG